MRTPEPSIITLACILNRPVLANVFGGPPVASFHSMGAGIRGRRSEAAGCRRSERRVEHIPGGRLVISCFTLSEMIREALDLQPGNQMNLKDGADWVRTELWDVMAKAPQDWPGNYDLPHTG